jgi:hypothetical protein
MFYCHECAERLMWPGSLYQSLGGCEMCGKKAVCYDTPSKYLPLPPQTT